MSWSDPIVDEVRRARDAYAARFNYDLRAHGVLSDVAQHIGAKGWLNAAKVTFHLGDESIQRLVLAAITDDGRTIESETAARLFFVPGTMRDEAPLAPGSDVEALAKSQLAATIAEVQRFAGQCFDEKSQQFNRYAADMEKGLDNEIADLELRVKELREQSREPARTLDQKLALQREASKLDRQKDEMVADRFARKRKIQDDVDRMLDGVAESLKLDPKVEPLFTLRWELTR